MAEVRRRGHVCWLCGRSIDLDLKWPDPWSFTVDHVEAVSLLDEDDARLLDPDNLRPAHFRCNVQKGNGQRAKKPTPMSRRW